MAFQKTSYQTNTFFRFNHEDTIATWMIIFSLYSRIRQLFSKAIYGLVDENIWPTIYLFKFNNTMCKISSKKYIFRIELELINFSKRPVVSNF